MVPECPRLPRRPGESAWIGSNPRRGLGVLAAAPWRLERVPVPRRLPRLVLPLLITGPTTFLLLAIWARKDPVHPYVRGIHRALGACQPLIERYPTVLLGDFNSNSIWDHEHPDDRSHSALVDRLGALGLVSAYHWHFREAQGRERQPTFYLYRHPGRPYHIDFCFLPRAWTAALRSVTVGVHADWAGSSDHMPLVVEAEIGARAEPGAGR